MICVLDHGSVAGLGAHDELRDCQLSREICQSQLRRGGARGSAGSATPRPKFRVAPAPGIHLRKGGLLNESVYFFPVGSPR